MSAKRKCEPVRVPGLVWALAGFCGFVWVAMAAADADAPYDGVAAPFEPVTTLERPRTRLDFANCRGKPLERLACASR